MFGAGLAWDGSRGDLLQPGGDAAAVCGGPGAVQLGAAGGRTVVRLQVQHPEVTVFAVAVADANALIVVVVVVVGVVVLLVDVDVGVDAVAVVVAVAVPVIVIVVVVVVVSDLPPSAVCDT